MNRTLNPTLPSEDKEANKSRFIDASTLLLSTCSLALTYFAFMLITESGFGFSVVINSMNNDAPGYAYAALGLIMSPGGLLIFGISMLLGCAGVLLHFNIARVSLIYLCLFIIFISILTVFCAALPGLEPMDRIWHGFGIRSHENLAWTSLVSLCTALFMVLLIRELRSKEFKDYYC